MNGAYCNVFNFLTFHRFKQEWNIMYIGYCFTYQRDRDWGKWNVVICIQAIAFDMQFRLL